MKIEHLRKIGISLQREIGQQLEQLRREPPLGKGAAGDVTQAVDRRAEEIIVAAAEKLGEPLTIVSEECGFQDIKGGGPRLLIDPIDGSRNAMSGIPFFSASIALVEGDVLGEVRIAYVINIMGGDEFWAERGGGSFRNGARIKTQQDDICKVIAYEAQVPRRDIPRIVPLLSLFNRARCFGSTALDMAYLSAGALSMFVTPARSRSFDFAAGYLLIREAGGIVTDLSGEELEGVAADIKRSVSLLASANAPLHARALEVLGADRA